MKSERSSLVENLKQKLEKLEKTNAKNRQSDEDQKKKESLLGKRSQSRVVKDESLNSNASFGC